MERYDYKANLKADALNYIKENFSFADAMDCFTTTNENGEPEFCETSDIIGNLADKFAYEMFVADEVTGNASGSYTFNTWEAEENLCHNIDLMNEVAEYFEIEPTITTEWKHGAEWWDVQIRCFLLNDVCYEIANDIVEEFDNASSREALYIIKKYFA